MPTPWRYLSQLYKVTRVLGPRQAARLIGRGVVLGRWTRPRELTIWPKASLRPLRFRTGSSDPMTLKQVFVDAQYAGVGPLPEAGWIVDCGANCGYSSAWFLSEFPSCQVVAIEPDPENFALMLDNLAGFGERARCLRAALWSESARLWLDPDSQGRSNEWGRTVALEVSAQTANPPIEGLSVAEVLRRFDIDRIALLKIDIEGAEKQVFSAPDLSWLARVDCIAIEIHESDGDGAVERLYREALRDFGFEHRRSGEILFSRRAGDRG